MKGRPNPPTSEGIVEPIARVSLLAGLTIVGLFAGLGTIGCTSLDPGPSVGEPTAAEVRAFFGLFPSSAWRYRRADGGTALVRVEGPNAVIVAGKSVYIRKARLREYESTEEAWYFDAAPGELRLRRMTSIEPESGDLITRRFADDSAPRVLSLTYDEEGAPTIAIGSRFETETRPELCETSCRAGSPERHRWSVLFPPEAVLPRGFEGQPSTAVRLEYTRADESSSVRATYDFVPGFGLVHFTDFAGTDYLICAAYVCQEPVPPDAGDATGSSHCRGDPALTCTP